ncbi:MAG: hypothetical protein MJ068_00730 [Clostridia bacterium]|nr:hypothetical protein [Clostridia bacterium]
MKGRVNPKYISLIFAGLFFSYLFRGVYSMYVSFSTLEDLRAANIALQAIYALFEYGAIPALLCYFIASIIYSIGFRHGARSMIRQDFIAQVCAVVLLVNTVTGFVDIFSILEPVTNLVINTAEPFILVLAFTLYFLLVMTKKYEMNPVEKFLSFRIYFMWLMILQAIEVALSDGLYFLVARSGLEEELAYQYGIVITRTAEILAIADVSIFFFMLIGVLILMYIIKAKAAEYVEKRKNGTYQQEEAEKNKPNEPDIFVFDNEDEAKQQEVIKAVEEKLKQMEKESEGQDDDHHDDINDIFDL